MLSQLGVSSEKETRDFQTTDNCNIETVNRGAYPKWRALGSGCREQPVSSRNCLLHRSFSPSPGQTTTRKLPHWRGRKGTEYLCSRRGNRVKVTGRVPVLLGSTAAPAGKRHAHSRIDRSRSGFGCLAVLYHNSVLFGVGVGRRSGACKTTAPAHRPPSMGHMPSQYTRMGLSAEGAASDDDDGLLAANSNVASMNLTSHRRLPLDRYSGTLALTWTFSRPSSLLIWCCC